MPDGDIILVGGYDGGRRNDTWRSTDNGVTWSNITGSPGWTGRSVSGTVMNDGSVIITGDSDITAPRNDTWRSTDEGITWTLMNASSGWTARYGPGVVALADNSVLLFGGTDIAGIYKNDTWRSTDNGATWEQMSSTAGWVGRYYAGSTATPNGDVLILGGKLKSEYAADVWKTSDKGITWSLVNASPGWASRQGPQVVTMPDHSIYLMGGSGSAYKNDTWRSTNGGVTWVQTNSSSKWTSRYIHATTVGSDGTIILTGGYDEVGSLNDTWRVIPVGSSAQNPTYTYPKWGNYTVYLTSRNAAGYNTSVGTTITSYLKRGYYGDSITLDNDWYGKQMQQMYEPQYQADHNVDGSGKSSTWLLANIGNFYSPLMKEFIPLVGNNDIRNNINGTVTGINIDGICRYVEANGTTCYPMMHTLENVTLWGDSSPNITITEAYLTAHGRSYTKLYDALDSIPNNGIMDDFNGTYMPDGVHPNYTGHTQMANYDWNNLFNFSSQFTPPGPINTFYPFGVAFTDTSTGSPTAWNWSYKVSGVGSDISFNTTQNATFFPPSWGNYTISLNASTVTAYSISSQLTWVNVSHLTSSFTTNVTSGVKPLTVMFNDTSYGGTATNWLWEFGDGGTSHLQNLTYTFDTGVYTVNLTVSDLYGSSTSQKTITVYSTSPPSLDAAFSASTTVPAVGIPVAFYDNSTGSPTTWNWSFGDGVNSTIQNPSHAYSTTGLKTVFLTVQNATSSDTETKVDYINVSTLGGFNQQDIWMDPQYVLILHVADSLTGLVIPDVSLTDSSTTYVTTNGTFILTYPYSTVVLTLASTGYAGKQVSYVMDSDREETVQLTAQSTSTTTTWYSPHQVRFAVISNTGTLLPGTTVNATANSTTMPDDYLTSLYGIDPAIANDMLNGTLMMSGVTGSDGAIVYTMHGSISYDISLTNPSTGTLFKIFLMPIENNYDIRLGATTANATYSQINATMLTVSEPDKSHFKLGVNYLDTSGLSNNMTFAVSCVANGTVLYTQEYTAFGTSAILSNYTLPNEWGVGYIWTYVAYRADGSVLSQGATVTGKGPNGVMVDLGLPSLNWYRWISVCILFMMGAMASQRTKQFWALLIPVFAALFLWFGWFTGTSSTAGIITLCVVLGAIVYMKSSLREKFGVGGPGTMLLNIVIYLLILQACVGFINGLNVWTDAGFGNQATAVVNQWSNIEISDISDLQNTGGWLVSAIATAEFFADMLLSAAFVFLNILFSIVTIYPTVQLLFPWMLASPQTIAFLALLQLGIWILYAKFMFDYFAKPSYGTDDF
jgi:PKD repeat protein